MGIVVRYKVSSAYFSYGTRTKRYIISVQDDTLSRNVTLARAFAFDFKPHRRRGGAEITQRKPGKKSSWKKHLTTAETANIAEKQGLMWYFPITHWVAMKKGLELKVFAVVELRF